MSDHDERDPQQTGSSGAFEAFRARRTAERTANETFPQQYLGDPAETLTSGAGDSEPDAPAAPPSGGQDAPGRYDQPMEYPPPPPPYANAAADPRPPRGRMRSLGVLGIAVVIVVGIAIGIHATVGGAPASGANAAAGQTSGAATGPVPSPTDTMRGRPGHSVTAKVTILSIGTDSFTGRTADGLHVTVTYGSHTKFGTAARPLTRAQLTPGAILYVRGIRTGTDGIAATILAGTAADAADGGSDA